LVLFEQEPDAGLHAAAEYVLQALGESDEIEGALERLRLTEEQIQERNAQGRVGYPLWHVNGQGQTMVVIRGPAQFVMGSPPGESGREASEFQHSVRISRTFAIAARGVTAGEFRRIRSGEPGPATASPAEWHAVTFVSWYEAAEYCNRLSQLEGIPADQWCYEVDANDHITRMRTGFLGLAGYRLPTEAEMEYATRAGTLTNRYYGESDELLAGYGWYVPNSNGSIQLVGRLRPNDFGLFDMYGNVWNWCQDKRRDYPQSPGETAFEDDVFDLDTGPGGRALRGGCYTDHATGLRSAHRWGNDPGHRSNIIGFRVARTIIAR
jgi:hypothetical protein